MLRFTNVSLHWRRFDARNGGNGATKNQTNSDWALWTTRLASVFQTSQSGMAYRSSKTLSCLEGIWVEAWRISRLIVRNRSWFQLQTQPENEWKIIWSKPMDLWPATIHCLPGTFLLEPMAAVFFRLSDGFSGSIYEKNSMDSRNGKFHTASVAARDN